MAGRVPNRYLPPSNGPKPINARKPKPKAPKLPTIKGAINGQNGGPPNLPGGGGTAKGTPGASIPRKEMTPAQAAAAAARLKAEGGEPVGYGEGGHPFYNIEKYHQSKAYRQGRKQGRPVVSPVKPPPPQQPLAMGNRLGGVGMTFPHVGAPAAAGSVDAHIEAARLAMVKATREGAQP